MWTCSKRNCSGNVVINAIHPVRERVPHRRALSIAHQFLKQRGLAPGQIQSAIADAPVAAGRVEADIGMGEARGVARARPAQHGTKARLEFQQLEWLEDVVVVARI